MIDTGQVLLEGLPRLHELFALPLIEDILRFLTIQHGQRLLTQ
jgi:hypothetical protein